MAHANTGRGRIVIGRGPYETQTLRNDSAGEIAVKRTNKTPECGGVPKWGAEKKKTPAELGTKQRGARRSW